MIGVTIIIFTGLLLWLAALKETPTMNEQFMQMFRFLIPLLERGDTSVKQCIQIIESYVLPFLPGAGFMKVTFFFCF